MSNDLFSLKDRVAVVTGGAGLLAAEHATALTGAGARVILADINEEKCTAAAGSLAEAGIRGVVARKLNVTQPESWQELLTGVIAEFGGVDILINNAGFTNQSKSANFGAAFEEFPLEDWNAILDVNLTGTFLGCQTVGKTMLERGSGAIINMASLYGVVSPNHAMYPGTGISQPVAYSVSKHGVIGLTRYLATLWAKHGVRVNSLTPGGIYNNHPDLFAERFAQLNPQGRMARKDELRGAIVYLASDASAHVIGHNLVVDGGWTVW